MPQQADTLSLGSADSGAHLGPPPAPCSSSKGGRPQGGAHSAGNRITLIDMFFFYPH